MSVDPFLGLLGLLSIAVIRSVLKYAITRMVLNRMADGQDLASVLAALALLFGARPTLEPPASRGTSSEPAPSTDPSESRDGDGGGDPGGPA